MTNSRFTDPNISYPRGMQNGTQDEHITNLRRRRNDLRATMQNTLLESKWSLPDVVSYTKWKILEQSLNLPQTLCLSICSSSKSKQTSRLLTLPNETLLMVYSYLDADSKAAFSFPCHSLLSTASLYLSRVWVGRSYLVNILAPPEYHSRHCAGCRKMRPIQFSYWNQDPCDNPDVEATLGWLHKALDQDTNPTRLIISNTNAIIDNDAMVRNLALSWTTQKGDGASTNSESETWSFRTLQHQRQNILEREFCPICTAQLLCEDIKLQDMIDKDAIYQSIQRAAAGNPVGSWDSRTGRSSRTPVDVARYHDICFIGIGYAC